MRDAASKMYKEEGLNMFQKGTAPSGFVDGYITGVIWATISPSTDSVVFIELRERSSRDMDLEVDR